MCKVFYIKSCSPEFDFDRQVRVEKSDGSGYSDGLHGEQIPRAARILTACDCLDAVASDRQYRRGPNPKISQWKIIHFSGQIGARRWLEVESPV